jgi:hypothetical protein
MTYFEGIENLSKMTREDVAYFKDIIDRVVPEEPEPMRCADDYATPQGEFAFAHRWAEWHKGQRIRSMLLSEIALANGDNQ